MQRCRWEHVVMWFEDLVGFREISGDDVRANLSVVGETLVSAVNGRRMGCGTLELASLAALRDRTATIASGAPGLVLRQVVGDAAALHRDPGNAGAMFQAASQFNLVEMVSPSVTPEAGVAGYQNDPTQGPACAIACGAGTILRNYFVDVNGRIGQSADNQIDCLADIASHLFPTSEAPWTMSNGYAMFDQTGLDQLNERLAAMTPSKLDEVRANLRIGVHRNAEVTSSTTGHSVTQAYCSALPVAYNHHHPNDFEPFARLVLEASYEATLRAAALNANFTDNPTVYLTMLGGGVFGNDESWIIDAIERACNGLIDVALDVVIVSYRSPTPAVSALVDRMRPHTFGVADPSSIDQPTDFAHE